MAGIPMPIYSRAYAQSVSCSPSVSSYVLSGGSSAAPPSDTISKTTFTCTVSSSTTITSPQYAYGGAYMFYKDPPPYGVYDSATGYYKNYYGSGSGQPGLNITVTNTADIDVTASADTALILAPGTSTSNLSDLAKTQSNALAVVSRGSRNWNKDANGGVIGSGGNAGAISITNSGTLTSTVGGGIYALSQAGDGRSAYRGGNGGDVTIVTTGDVTGSSSGIVAISQGGRSSGPVYGYYFNAQAGSGGNASVTAYGSVSATSSGPAILAASYGGNSPRAKSGFADNTLLRTEYSLKGGAGGNAGSSTVTVGSSDTPFAGTIATTASGKIGTDSPARASGAAIAAMSVGGQGISTVADGGDYTNYYTGGTGGAVTVTVTATSDAKITTKGASSPGVIAQSAGGASKSGYYSNTYVGGDAGAANVTLGGGGSISTSGDGSSGIVAQSLGGAGQSTFYDSSYGKAGKGGTVNVTNDFAITTEGDRAHGIVAQSAAAAAGYGILTNTSGKAVVWGDQNDNSVGSDAVSVTNHGAIAVHGVDAHGIVAQSLGGGGGLLASTTALSRNGNGSLDSGATQQVGGYSGSADGASVTVKNYGAITTYGGYASGTAASTSRSGGGNPKLGGGIAILAQSVGGGGGVNTGLGAYGVIGGGYSSQSTSGTGSNGGTVTVTNAGALKTYGSEAHGIVAQSIGGGGGTGRNSDGLFKAVGGAGGPGGTGGDVTVNSQADITLSGDYAAGIVAQSVGGGGGQGGKASSWGLFFSEATGGTGGAGGDGGTSKIYTSSGTTISTGGINAIGAHAQSIGGGGGTGGAAKSSSDGLLFDFAIATGGNGGDGGDGGTAYVKHDGAIATKGYDSAGILVQSIGGGGGAGGGATSKALGISVPVSETGTEFSATISIAHGGSGGSGGSGGEAKAITHTDSSVTTSGAGSIGLHVQSIGGGGGAGGDSSASSASVTLAEFFEKEEGGDDNDDESGGDDSGGGENAKSSASSGGGDDGGDGKKPEPKNISIKLDVSLGGSGGDGGDGQTAFAHSYGAITTTGQFSDGILVQSIGGGGGQGGTGESEAATYGGGTSVATAFTLGGSGGKGGHGGTATGGVAGSGMVSTSGTGSRGLVVHSIGGGGGSAGGGSGDLDAGTTLSVGVGGAGGDGGDGGSVYAWNAGTIKTQGDWSHGLIAQSIGGGGGIGGSGTSSVSHEKEFEKKFGKEKRSVSLTTQLTGQTGGSGGSGGDGGTVLVGKMSPTASIAAGKTYTYSAFSPGILAQSIGGGGGAVAQSSSTDAGDDNDVPDFSKLTVNAATITIGASGGTGGSGGSVSVYANSIYTKGFASHGIVAQSIGGGGGTGISTGFAMSDIDLSFGGTGSDSSANTGGAVKVSTGSGVVISTTDSRAMGIIAQSIGGGGGLGDVSLGTGSAVNDDSLSDLITISSIGTDSDPKDTTSLDGGTVSIDHSGTVSTKGERAVGIVAQSIGAGGGFLTASETSIKSVSFVSEQSRGAGYAVTVALQDGSSIVTTGDGGIGVLAQSIGGGGGVFADLNAPLTTYYVASESNYTYDKGDGRHSSVVTVTVDSNASISTTGNYAHGIVAQSVAGSGGIFEKNGKTYAGSLHRNGENSEAGVAVTVNGSVATKADNAWAIWGQTQDTYVNVTVGSGGSVAGSSTSSGTGGAIFAAVDSDGSVKLDNSGTVSGNVVKSVAGKETWSKDYAATNTASSAADGAVRLSAVPATGQAMFLNQGTGTFVTGAIADLDTVLNAGSINIGGTDRFLQTQVTGDLLGLGTSGSGSAIDVNAAGLKQAFAAAHYYSGIERRIWRDETSSRGGLLTGVDLDMEYGEADQLIVRGDFAGTWGAMLDPEALLPNTRTDLIKVLGTDTSDLTVLSSLVFDFTDVTTSSAGWKGFEVQSATFANTGVALGRNATGVSKGLQSAWDKIEDGSAQPIRYSRDEISIANAFAAFHAATPETLETMLREVASETTVAGPAGSSNKAITAANSVLSCPAFTTGAVMDEGECVWGRFLGGRATQDATSNSTGYKDETSGIQTGGQKALGDGWFLGGSLTYEDSWLRNDAGTEKVRSSAFTAAGALKKEVGPWLFALVGGAGYTWSDSSRYMTLGPLSAVAEAEPKTATFFGRARASYEFTFDERFYLQPRVDLDVITIHQEGYRESGAGALNLIVDDATATLFGVTPGVEFGRRYDLSDDLPARLFAGVGVSFMSDDTWESTARLAGVTNMEQFTTAMPIADVVGRVSAGVDLQKVHGMQLKLQYDGSFADGYQSHGGSLRFGYRF
ncbi:autotransporter outer membrane beta-barrel domain-containing protein [Amorphus coralli]|uniref:autotransporter outer membrane beta-barrel domain-containing protein n=1 Tax=Amorphus coralli TaxID=340680 RepID=UPI000378A2B2|nr:autotransporter outer membrane beta-barrel domain-containing protein [Amorphus coralli]